MSEPKFNKGDLARIIVTGEKVIVLEYKVNYVGSVFNALQISGEKKFPDSVMTDEILCEGKIDGKFQRKYIREASLELISSAQ